MRCVGVWCEAGGSNELGFGLYMRVEWHAKECVQCGLFLVLVLRVFREQGMVQDEKECISNSISQTREFSQKQITEPFLHSYIKQKGEYYLY